MRRIFDYFMEPADEGNTISAFLKGKGYSRHILTHLKKMPEGICVNGLRAYTTHKLSLNDHIRINLVEEECSSQILPVKMPLHIVYEDEDIMVINKAADVPIHPSINNYDNTLANGIAHYFAEKGEPFIYRCINRLDRDTTGLLILAKHMLSAAILSEMVKKRHIHREYLAIVKGLVPQEGIIDAPIARKPDSVMERIVCFESGEQARTHYKSVYSENGYSLVSLKLETGRTHQIRVHMKFLGYPLIGDYLYYPNYELIQRQALHSHRLQFVHPISGKQMRFESPLPADMENCLLKVSQGF